MTFHVSRLGKVEVVRKMPRDQLMVDIRKYFQRAESKRYMFRQSEFAHRHFPRVGDYFVIYQDGTTGFLPPTATVILTLDYDLYVFGVYH